MKKFRIFAAFLLIVAMFAFAGCSKDDKAQSNVGAGNTTGSGVVDDAGDALDRAADDMADGMENMGDSIKDSTSGAAVNNN